MAAGAPAYPAACELSPLAMLRGRACACVWVCLCVRRSHSVRGCVAEYCAPANAAAAAACAHVCFLARYRRLRSRGVTCADASMASARRPARLRARLALWRLRRRPHRPTRRWGTRWGACWGAEHRLHPVRFERRGGRGSPLRTRRAWPGATPARMRATDFMMVFERLLAAGHLALQPVPPKRQRVPSGLSPTARCARRGLRRRRLSSPLRVARGDLSALMCAHP